MVVFGVHQNLPRIEDRMRGANSETLVAFGEALWDCLPSGLFLGGAPFNVAYHAARLGANAFPATSVGRDFLGDRATDLAKSAGLDISLIHRHPFLTTGVAIAQLDELGNATYDIRRPVAWDEIELVDEQRQIIDKAGVFVYGTLAARSESNRDTLAALLKSGAKLKICDVNLRPPFVDRDRVIELATQADIVKVNEDELFVLAGDDGKDKDLEKALARCQETLKVKKICVTMGGDGAALWNDGELSREKIAKIEVADTIGAGDAFTAALAVYAMRGHDWGDCLKKAVRLGSFVASKHGAQPHYDPEDVFRDG